MGCSWTASWPIVYPDSVYSSIYSKVCTNTPSEGLVGAAPLSPLVVASGYCGPPSAPIMSLGWENLNGVHHTCSYFHTHNPSEMVVLGLKYAHSVSWFACSLIALDAAIALQSLEVLYTATSANDREKLVTRKKISRQDQVFLWLAVLDWPLSDFRPHPPARPWRAVSLSALVLIARVSICLGFQF